MVLINNSIFESLDKAFARYNAFNPQRNPAIRLANPPVFIDGSIQRTEQSQLRVFGFFEPLSAYLRQP
jgi:hypothetical protein